MAHAEQQAANAGLARWGQDVDAASSLAWRRALERHYRRMSRRGGVTARCYLWLPDRLEGLTVLDIGCRNGKGLLKVGDQVGDGGRIWGLEWDRSRAAAARALIAQDAQAGRGGRERAGSAAGRATRFQVFSGYPEDLEGAGIGPSSVDAVVVNSVFNLVFDISTALRSIWRALRTGGALYCDTVVTARSTSEAERQRCCAQADPYGAAFTEHGLLRRAQEAGFSEVRFVDSTAEHAADRPSCADQGPRARGCRNVVMCARKA